MIALLRVTDPLRLLLVVVIFFLLRLALFYNYLPITGMEVFCGLVGHHMAEGKTMYADIWDNTPPLSAGFFWLVHLLFGSQPLTYQLIGMAIVALQAVIFNYIALQHNLYNEKNYLPALFYCLFALTSFETATLSPQLLSVTLLLLLLNSLLHLRDQVTNENLFVIGAYTATAALFYYPAIIFILFVFVSLPLIRSFSYREFVIIVLGMLFVPLLPLTYYYYVDALEDFVYNFWLSLFLPERFVLSGNLVLLLMALPATSFFSAVVKTYASSGAFVNFQQLTHRLMLLWVLLVAIAAGLFSQGFSGYSFILLAVPYSFFLAHYFLLLRKHWTTDLLAILLVISLPAVSWLTLAKQSAFPPSLQYSYLLPSQPLPLPRPAERILVLSDQWQYYYGRKLATPYLNLLLAARHLQQLDQYTTTQAVYVNIIKDMPELIICPSPERDAIQLFEKLQILRQWYAPDKQYPMLFYKKDIQ